MNNIDKQYQDLLSDIISNGRKKEDRTGTGTLSVFGRQIRHKMSEGFPLLILSSLLTIIVIFGMVMLIRII